jgi:hypothetical protein
MTDRRKWTRALEFALVTIVVSVAMVVFLKRVDLYRESAERTAMEHLARDIGWALRLHAAELMLANRSQEIARLEDANPIEALDLKVARYAGAGPSADEASVPPGRWYFNRETRELRYFPELTSGFTAAPGGRPRVAWRVKVIWQAPLPGAAERPQWVRLELVQPYRWGERPAAENGASMPMLALREKEG